MPNLDLNILQILYGDTPVNKIMYGDTKVWPKLPYDEEIGWIGLNLISQGQYIKFDSVPGFNGSQIGNTDVINLKVKSIFNKPQNGRNFIASFGLDSFFHYTEINNSKIGGYAYNKVIGLFDYVEDTPIEINMRVSNNSFYAEFIQEGQINSLSYQEAAKTVVPATIGAMLPSGAWSYNSAQQKIIWIKIEVNGVITFDAIPVRVGQVGYMYDKVSQTLFGNAGTGSFTLGPDVT